MKLGEIKILSEIISYLYFLLFNYTFYITLTLIDQHIPYPSFTTNLTLPIELIKIILNDTTSMYYYLFDSKYN